MKNILIPAFFVLAFGVPAFSDQLDDIDREQNYVLHKLKEVNATSAELSDRVKQATTEKELIWLRDSLKANVRIAEDLQYQFETLQAKRQDRLNGYRREIRDREDALRRF